MTEPVEELIARLPRQGTDDGNRQFRLEVDRGPGHCADGGAMVDRPTTAVALNALIARLRHWLKQDDEERSRRCGVSVE